MTCLVRARLTCTSVCLSPKRNAKSVLNFVEAAADNMCVKVAGSSMFNVQKSFFIHTRTQALLKFKDIFQNFIGPAFAFRIHLCITTLCIENRHQTCALHISVF